MAKASLTVTKLAQLIPTEAAAYEYLEKVRWNGRPVCPHCGSLGDHRFLKPANGVSRETNRGKQSERRVWKCRDCKKQFSAMTGTIFHGSKVPLRTWLFVCFEIAANKNGIAAREIERKYGVAPKTAWFMAHRLREAMKRNAPMHLFGTIVSDETWIGGEPKNMHKVKREERKNLGRYTDKTPVLALINKETGEVRSQVVARVRGDELLEVMRANVSMNRSKLETDSAGVYRGLGWLYQSHTSVDHHAGEYVAANGASTNVAENYFSQLKRSLDGTHHHVSVEHLDRYLAEFDFHYTTREINDEQRMNRLLGQSAGRRLSYMRFSNPVV